ncbi:MAG: formate/nitrite transporter family protein [Anaerolineales bacterium]
MSDTHDSQPNPDNADSPIKGPPKGEAVHDYFSADEIFQRVAATADEEMGRHARLMFFSGIAAGLSIGLAFFARVAITAEVPDTPLVGNLLYPLGFILIVVGRYQLFTENTLTPVTLVLTRLASLPSLLRVWGTVLVANLVGSTVLALLLAYTDIFSPAASAVAVDFWEHAISLSWETLFFKAVMAGWLVASMVWLVHAARETISRLILVFLTMYLIPSADLYHCIIGFCEAMYAVFLGEAALGTAIFSFFLPVLLGNTVGGVLLVAILNFAMTEDSRFPTRDEKRLRLSWRQWVSEYHTGSPNS